MGKEDQKEQEQETQEEEVSTEEETTEEEETESTEDDDVNENQVERLRKEKEEALEAKEEAEKTLTERLEALEQNQNKKQQNDLLDEYAGKNEDTRKALLQEFEKYRPGENDPDAVRERMKMAARIVSSDPESPSILDGTTGAGGGINKDKGGEEKDGVSDSVKEQGKVLDISDEDYEKYGNKDN